MTKTIDTQEEKALKSLSNLALNLDSEMGGIGCNLETLWNVKVTLDNLRVSMDNRDENEICAYFREDHRTVQILTDLMRYTMTELGEYHQKAYDTQHEMFEEIMKINDKKAPAVTGAGTN